MLELFIRTTTNTQVWGTWIPNVSSLSTVANRPWAASQRLNINIVCKLGRRIILFQGSLLMLRWEHVIQLFDPKASTLLELRQSTYEMPYMLCSPIIKLPLVSNIFLTAIPPSVQYFLDYPSCCVDIEAMDAYNLGAVLHCHSPQCFAVAALLQICLVVDQVERHLMIVMD